ncbi:delta-60 repeat domain-containing protein [Flavobacterium sp.]|uniref:delta-60 repeat domain-containing protein n=1 Tax=Flavobacterium sp. TaxID=239 RepID=UPI0039E6D816
MKKLLLLFTLSHCCFLSAQDGFLDPTFGDNGIVNTCLTPAFANAGAIAIGSDNKIVVGGSIVHAMDDSDFCVVRYLSDGTPDPTFGTNGIVTTEFPSFSTINDIATKSGKIIVAGSTIHNAQLTAVIAQYNSNGSLDDAFGTNGIALIPIPVTDDAGASKITLLPKWQFTGDLFYSFYSFSRLALFGVCPISS